MDSKYKIGLLLTVLLIQVLLSKQQIDPHFVNDRSTIVHLFEWKWNDIGKECEQFLAPNGFAGVQVSPITENVIIDNSDAKRPWWERYQVISYNFTTRSGNQQQFAEMVQRCNRVGVRIFVDVIMNHMSGTSGPQGEHGTGGSKSQASIKSYPAVPYEAHHFHPTCQINNWDDAVQLRNCELVGLHDLNQTEEFVRDKLITKLNRMVELGVGGFRLDAAKHMYPEDLKVILESVNNLNTNEGFGPNSRAFVYQEVIPGSKSVTAENYFDTGAVTEFQFGRFLTEHIRGNTNLNNLKTLGPSWGLIDSDHALVFVDNHDTQRNEDILTYKDSKRYKMAVAFMLAHPYPKIVRVMSSFDFKTSNDAPPQDANENLISPTFNSDGACTNGWICEHRWRQIYNMVQFRNVVHGTDMNNWWDNGSNQIAFCRGNKGFIVINKYGDVQQHLQTCLPSGEYCDIISGKLQNNQCTGKKITVNGDGTAYIELMGLEYDGVLAIHINAKINKAKI